MAGREYEVSRQCRTSDTVSRGASSRRFAACQCTHGQASRGYLRYLLSIHAASGAEIIPCTRFAIPAVSAALTICWAWGDWAPATEAEL